MKFYLFKRLVLMKIERANKHNNEVFEKLLKNGYCLYDDFKGDYYCIKFETDYLVKNGIDKKVIDEHRVNADTLMALKEEREDKWDKARQKENRENLIKRVKVLDKELTDIKSILNSQGVQI